MPRTSRRGRGRKKDDDAVTKAAKKVGSAVKKGVKKGLEGYLKGTQKLADKIEDKLPETSYDRSGSGGRGRRRRGGR